MAIRTHWGAAGDVAASRHGVFHRSRAAEMQMSDATIRRLKRAGHLDEPAPGVLVVVGSPDTWQRRLEIATLGSRGAGAAGFATAATLHRIDGYAHGSVPDLVVPSWRRQLTSVATLHIGPFDASDFVQLGGWRTTNSARTLCDLAGRDPLSKVHAAFESVWRSGASLEWIRRTAERLARPRRPGPGIVLGLVEEAMRFERPTGSTLEVELGEILRGIPGLVRQHSIHAEDGSFIARPDFAVLDVQLAIEAHSRRFHFGPHSTQADEEREIRMTTDGWLTMYFGAGSMRKPARVRADVEQTIARRRQQLIRGIRVGGGSTGLP